MGLVLLLSYTFLGAQLHHSQGCSAANVKRALLENSSIVVKLQELGDASKAWSGKLGGSQQKKAQIQSMDSLLQGLLKETIAAADLLHKLEHKLFSFSVDPKCKLPNVERDMV